MRRLLLVLTLSLCVLSSAHSQLTILEENFANSAWTGNPSDYPGYTSEALFSGDDTHAFTLANSSGYPEASGGVAILMGNWNSVANTEFVIQCNTEGYINIQLSFGIKHNSGGWPTCQLTNNYTLIEYSTDSTLWIPMDKAQLLDGSSWPCAEDDLWAFVKLAEVLPTSSTLYIRFTHTDPAIHPYSLDDITLTAYVPDNNPPMSPTNLSADWVDFNSFTMAWDAATDDGGINHYKVFRDGKYLLSTVDTIVQINYQKPGSSADFSVIAYDIANNESSESAILPVTFEAKPVDYKYSWERKDVKILPSGEMEWQPKDFIFVEGSSTRYIDYENGDDSNDGLSKASPWKHHPWDIRAAGHAAKESGIHTYVFKRGVVYRGQLEAQESGTPLEPIRLTSDPSWGTGEAAFYGSKMLEGTWQKANSTIAPNIPNPEQVWYLDVSLPSTKMLCEIEGDIFKELRVARSPNYQYTPDDPLKTWYTWTGKSSTSGGIWLQDTKNLTQFNKDYYKGATVFSQEDAIVMCTVWKQDVSEWDPTNNRVKVASSSFGGKGCHYYIENTPFLLDTCNEFYYNKTAGRLFLRLAGDKDPNDAVIEAAIQSELIRIQNKHDIEISGITFGITTAHIVRYGQNDAISAIRMMGICNNINILNNQFKNVVGGVSLDNNGSNQVNTHSITVSDNDFQNISDLAIVFATNTVYMDDISILRNNIYNNGYRHQGRSYSSIPAIYAQLNYGEVAGNIIDVSWGNGIDVFWGKGEWQHSACAFIRGLIHHNSASNTLIGTNDYGGIESWQGGPAFCYNNNSHNASGYKHYNNTSIGYAYYFDGSFKHIVFNNIASGVSHNRNSAAIMQVLGYYNIYAQNSAYMTDRFFNAWKESLAVCGYNTYLSNVGQDIKKMFNHEISPENIPFDSYGSNISSGISFNGSIENLNDNLSLGAFQNVLAEYKSQLTQSGYNASANVLPNAKFNDFRAQENSDASERGVKFFTAFPLSHVVGEWNFYKHPADLSIIMGDNFYMTEDFSNRETYKDIPKNHLTAFNLDSSNFVFGDLEDWTEGALVFNGAVYCSLEHAVASAVKSNNIDMTDNDFIIETYLKTQLGHTGGSIVSKYQNAEGYELAIDASGSVSMALYEAGGIAVSRISASIVNDSLWHHILVEVNRYDGIDIYVDGELSNGAETGMMPAKELSLTNTADFLVGKDADDHFFLGKMDFLRISKGSLYDARTTVDEIYTWETDGPFLYDIKGNAPEGKRDAGAIESFSACDFTVSETSLDFDYQTSSLYFISKASDGIIVRNTSDDYLTIDKVNDTVFVTVKENHTVEERIGTITVLGCGGSQDVSVKQAAGPCTFSCKTDTLKLSHIAQNRLVAVASNSEIIVSDIDMDFLSVQYLSGMDSLMIGVEENFTIEERSGTITLQACEQSHEITVIQAGAPCSFSCEVDTLKLSHLQQEVVIHVQTNSYFTVGVIPEGFVGITSGPTMDSVVINIQENQSSEARTSELPLSGCDLVHTIIIIQDGLVGTANYSQNGGLEIFPNPVKAGLINIRLPDTLKKGFYKVTDLTGKEVQNGIFYNNNNAIEIAVKSGTYILSVVEKEQIYKARMVVL